MIPPALKAGIAVSLSGPFATLGRQALDGLSAWVRDTNSAGGLLVGPQRRRIDLYHHDDTGRKERAQHVTERLILNDRVDLLFGPYSSVLTLAAAGVALRYRKLLWNHGGAAHQTSGPGVEWLVNILTPAERYFHGVIDLALTRKPASPNITLVYSSRGAFPQAVATGAADYAATLGLPQPVLHPYQPVGPDLSGVVDSLKASDAGLILGVGRLEDDITLARALLDAGIPPHRVALIATPTQQFKEALGSRAEGFLGPSQWEHNANIEPDYGPSASDLGLADADYPRAQAYAAGLVAQRCIEEAGTLEDTLLLNTALRSDFTTFYGRFRLDPATRRQVGHQMVVVQWRCGAKRVVWPPQAVPSPDAKTACQTL